MEKDILTGVTYLSSLSWRQDAASDHSGVELDAGMCGGMVPLQPLLLIFCICGVKW